MGSFGQCSICGERILYSPDCLADLGAHLIEKHPNSEVGHFSLVCKNDLYGEKSFEIVRQQKKKSRFYKTTIESWKGAKHPQKCTKCGKFAEPLIRRQRHKLAKSPLGALLLLGCWPICFLPFILGGSDLMYLYCRECGNFLGVYDRRTLTKDSCATKNGTQNEPFCHCD